MKVLPVGTRLQCGSVLLEVTQIGKDCHSHCTIYYQMGKCIMPSNGIFARVLQEGEISVRDTIQVLPETGKEPFRAAVITLSDKGAAGESKIQAVKLGREIGFSKAAIELGVNVDTLYGWNKRAKDARLDLEPGTQTPDTAMSLTEEVQKLRQQTREQAKEIARLKEENEFLAEASAFFAASRRKSAKT